MRLSVPTIVLGLCAVFAAASPMPDTSDLSPRTPLPPNWDPKQVTIQKVSWAGSGCPAGTATATPNEDWTILTLAFGEAFTAKIGPGYPFDAKRRNCVVTFTLNYPHGITVALHKIDYYGRYDLQEKVEGTLQARYWFAGTPNPARPICKWVGKKAESFVCTDNVVSFGIVPPKCGISTNLNVNIEVFLNNDNDPTKSGTINADAVDKSLKTLLNLQWKNCV